MQERVNFARVMHTKRILLSLLCLCSLLSASAQQSDDHRFEVAKNIDIFNAIYSNLDLMYVDTLNPGEVIGYGINAMLRSLDPYTEYYPAEKNKELNQMLTGKYGGIGSIVRYHQRLKNVVIDEPYEFMPAAEVGLKKGDIILSIDDSVMTDKTVSEVSDKLRGEPGSTFMLKVKRPTTGKEMTFKITRRNIKLPEIPYYGMRPDGVGYIALGDFTQGCSKTMRRAFNDLKEQGAKKLILDLRGNGGGSLAEAIDIINMWVAQGLTLVETKGKLKQANKSYVTRYEPIDTLMPMVVLVNGNTASASEITAGSVQDLDRGLVVGTRTYGKGLVQVPMDLPYNATLKFTTSKYYIPSGRCIQAVNYKHGGGGYKERIPDSLTTVFHTKHGREVRDGGGIKPDVEVKADSLPNILLYLDRVDSMEVMFDYVVDYIHKHPTIAPAEEFHLTDEDFEEFKALVIKSGFTYDQVSSKAYDELVRVAKFEGYYDSAKAEFEALKAKLTHDVSHDMDRAKKDIMLLLEQDIISAYYYQAGAMKASLSNDPQVREAERIINDREEYQKLLSPKNE